MKREREESVRSSTTRARVKGMNFQKDKKGCHVSEERFRILWLEEE